MNQSLTLPAMLNMPPKLLPIITDFNSYEYFLLEGGRGSAKTHSVARLLLYLASVSKLRIVCGREIQTSIEESVHAVLGDLIEEFDLHYDIKAKRITHLKTGSVFTFKGFRDQGKVKIKGMEGVDILWIDEAQSMTNAVLDVLIPTIRKDNAKRFFTMNKFMADDAVPEWFENRADCLHIHINYFENPFCPESTKIEAANLKAKSQREYEHIYLGIPLATAGDILFNYDQLEAAKNLQFFGATSYPARILAFDFAAQGDDQCVATILDRITNQHWEMVEQIAWDEPDSMISIGKIVNLIGQHNPDISILDVGGMGHVVFNRLEEIGVDIKRFDGAGTKSMGIDGENYVNARAHGYYDLKDWFDQGFLKINSRDGDCIQELKKIKTKFRSNGKRILQPKEEMKKELGYSPDRADSLMMAVWAANHYLGEANSDARHLAAGQLRRVSNSRKRRR